MQRVDQEVGRFSDETRGYLTREGYLIYTLSGKSIRFLSLEQVYKSFWFTLHQDYPEFESLPSRRSEVAINPAQLFLPDSNNKTLEEQRDLISLFSKEFKGRNRIRDMEVVLGEFPDYAELVYTHFAKTDERLFGERYNCDYTRTNSNVGSKSVFVGNFKAGDGLSVYVWDPDSRYDTVWVAPLVVPA